MYICYSTLDKPDSQSMMFDNLNSSRETSK